VRGLLLLVALFFSGVNPVVPASLPVAEKTVGNDAVTQCGTDFFCAADDFRFAFGKEENTVSTGSNLKNDTKKHFTFSSPELAEQQFSCFFRTASLKLFSGFGFPYYILFRRLLL
jgi:hypothetical protein